MSTSADDREIESLLALSQNGEPFTSHAARLLLQSIRLLPRLSYEVCYWMTVSALKRGDLNRARKNLLDWSGHTGKPVANITKFTPGKHYHTLGKRFDSYDEALNYLNNKGFRLGNVYTVEARPGGD